MKNIIYVLMVLMAAGCKESYISPVQSPITGYLVLEGSINSNGTAAAIALSRTTKLDSQRLVNETGASVQLEGDDNSVVGFREITAGQYGVDNLSLKKTSKYRIRIKPKSGKEYLSDFVPVNNNPVIDSISWKRENSDGLQLYMNTHDAQNNTHYYQWTYSETWEIHSSYTSSLKYKIAGPPPVYSVVYKDSSTFSFDPTIVTCWQSFNSNTLILGSTVKLTSDIVYLPIEFLPRGSVKLSVLYSIDVKQYTWTKEGYAFLENMKKNTEATGSVFDAQPSELKGNIYCTTDPNEPVIGFLNICPAQEKRIFISNAQAPRWNYDSGCFSVEIENISDSIFAKGVGLTPTEIGKSRPTGAIETFYAAPPSCVDCTLRGTNKKPAFWP